MKTKMLSMFLVWSIKLQFSLIQTIKHNGLFNPTPYKINQKSTICTYTHTKFNVYNFPAERRDYIRCKLMLCVFFFLCFFCSSESKRVKEVEKKYLTSGRINILKPI